MMQRRHWLAGLAATSATALLGSAALAPAFAQSPLRPGVLPPLQVWKDPNCGCCGDWVDYLRADGFTVQVNDVGNTAIRQRLGLPSKYGSCHTGLIAGYVIEGHVNAREIRRLITERPNALGLAVPGMPVGSPGMDGEVYGNRRDPYDVLLVMRDGTSRVYASYFRT